MSTSSCQLQGPKQDPPTQDAGVADPRVTFYDQAYRDDNTIWDAGRPQPALVSALTKNERDPTKTVLEVGCGRARPLLWMATRGFKGTGIDSSQHVIEQATKTAQQMGLSERVTFKVFDYRSLSTLGSKFDIVIDCAFSHILSVEQRHVYAQQIAAVTNKGGRLYILSYAGEAEITSQMIKDRVLPPNFQTNTETQTQTQTGTGTGTATGTDTGTGTGAGAGAGSGSEASTEQDNKSESAASPSPSPSPFPSTSTPTCPSSDPVPQFSIPSGMTENDIHTLYPGNKGWATNSIQTVTFVAANGATGPCLLSILTYVGEETSDTSQPSQE